MNKLEKYCRDIYSRVYSQEIKYSEETYAQKEAIRAALTEGIKHFSNVEAAEIWHAVYAVHVHRKSGIIDTDTIAKVISADQSWKKSSGHAFEEMIKMLGTSALKNDGIEIILQRDLNVMIKAGELSNEPRDISWLKAQVRAGVFDLYAVVQKNDSKKFCYGCIQSKTSIRDRVTRDREPSIQAMRSFFWSTIIVLDGGFLRLPKFIAMVNGGTTEYPQNGWHGLYVFSENFSHDRIYPINLNFINFREHAVNAANYWLTQRQWFNEEWRPDIP